MSSTLYISTIMERIKTFFRKYKSSLETKIELKNIISKNWKNLNHLCIYFEKNHYRVKKLENSFSFHRMERKKYDGSSVWEMKWEYNDIYFPVSIIMKVSFDTFKNYEIKIYKEFTKEFILTNKTPHLLFYIKSEKTISLNKKYYCFLELLKSNISSYLNTLPPTSLNTLPKDFSYIIMEYANGGSLGDYIRDNIKRDNLAENIEIFLFQLKFTLYIIYLTYPKFRHNDLSCENILLSYSSNHQEGFYLYKINENIYKIKNIGYQIRLYDFDQSDLNENSISNKGAENKKTKNDIEYFYSNIEDILKKSLLLFDIENFINILRDTVNISSQNNRTEIQIKKDNINNYINYKNLNINSLENLYKKYQSCSVSKENLIYQIVVHILNKVSFHRDHYIESKEKNSFKINIEKLSKDLRNLLKKNKEIFDTIIKNNFKDFKRNDSNSNGFHDFFFQKFYNKYIITNEVLEEDKIIDKYNFYE